MLTLRFRHPRDFDDRERALLVDFSTAVAVAMRNASLVGDLERRATRSRPSRRCSSRCRAPSCTTSTPRSIARSRHRCRTRRASRCCSPTDVAPLFRPQLIVVDGIVTWSPALPAVPLTECAASIALRTGQPVVSNQPVRSWGALVPGRGGDLGRRSLASEIAVPMVHGDHTLGVLIVQSGHRGAFTTKIVELLSIIARQAGVAIENARLFEAQREEREMAEAAARVAAHRPRRAPTAADAAAAILDVVGDVVSHRDGAAIGLLHRR